jgi:methylglutaconyl-CoA hydratase
MTPRKTTRMTPTSMRVQFVVDEAVGRITLARPEKRNALDPEAIRQLRAAIEAAARDESVRVVTIAADGPDFCAGADLDSLAALLEANEEVHRADASSFVEVFLAMRNLPKPIIAAVHGRALAGGAGLVCACDIVIAADSAQLGFPEVKIGFVPAIVVALLRHTVGEKAAFELVSTGRSVRADEALRIGLVTRIVAGAALTAEVDKLAGCLAELPPDALASTKRLFYQTGDVSLQEGMAQGVEANVAARMTEAFRQGVAGFVAGRRR